MKIKLLLILFLFGFMVSVNADTSDTDSKIPVVLAQNYPNPAKGKTLIIVEFSSEEAVLSIYNVLGKLVEQRVISADQKRINLDVSEYQEGIYLYSIEADGQKVTKRMTVSK